LGGCATKYQSSGITGGHDEIPGPGKLEKVFFFGNGFTKPEDAQSYAIYRIAEIGTKKNKPYFLMYQSLSAAAREIPATSPNLGVVGNKPTAYAFVLFLDTEKKGSFNTAKVLKDLDWVIQGKDATAAKEQGK
jgi:hypothetical protein